MAEDEAVRDLKRALDNHASPRLPSSRSAPHVVDALHPDIGRPRDIAQPGGFRRNHILRNSSSEPLPQAALGLMAAAQEPLALDRLLDPRLMRGFRGMGRGRTRAYMDGEAAAANDDATNGSSGGSSNASTALLLLKSTIGGTLILIPGAFKDAGVAAAIAVLMFIGGIEIHCMALLVRCSQAMGGGSYGEIVGRSMGPVGYWAVDVSLVLSQLGFVCAEMLYVAKNVNGALEKCFGSGHAAVPSETTILLAQILLSVPLSWIRQLEYFKWTNLIANFTVMVALVVISCFSIAGLAKDGVAEHIHPTGKDWLLFIGTAVFCFECINFVIPLYEEHEDKDNFVPLLTVTLWGVMFLFIFFGVVNYLAYGANTKPTVTLNLPSDSVVGKAVPLAFALASLLNIPLFMFPASVTLEGKLVRQDQPARRRKWRKNGLRTALVLGCTGVSIVGADKMEAMIALIGSVCCVPLAFIYPAISHLVLCRPGLACKAADVFIAVLGFALFVGTTWQALLDML